ncbi:MAG TPA: hypothetical protein VEW28_02760 [Candidatus Kapabacteria bacterium]|nr:hypothetical protein [Candidatus Kapabacteria bacterium]HYM34519.1 hypothetical protein [Steroidobacteraceae bacterium]
MTVLLLCAAHPVFGQQEPTIPLPQFVVTLDGAGFIPFDQSYRLNYKSSLLGLPVEWAASLGFPLNESLTSSIELRYRRRTAELLSDFRITQLEITPGIRAYLEKPHPNDLRLYGSAGLLLVNSVASGSLSQTRDGTSPVTAQASKNYYNIGIALGLGIEYPFNNSSSLYGGLRVGVYFADPVSTGGLGDAGGVSLGIGFRYAIY